MVGCHRFCTTRMHIGIANFVSVHQMMPQSVVSCVRSEDCNLVSPGQLVIEITFSMNWVFFFPVGFERVFHNCFGHFVGCS
jgi:hypothetical protein